MPSVSDLFEIRYGHGLELNAQARVEAPDGVNFVGRAARGNGITARIAMPLGISPGVSGEMTVALNGQGGALASFVQPAPFVTGYHIAILQPHNESMPLPERLWWARCIWENHYRYGFGRQANRTLGTLHLPDEKPDFVKTLAMPTGRPSADASVRTALPDPTQWTAFALGDLFEINKGSRITKRDQRPGTTPFIGAKMIQNGISARITGENTFPGKSISVPYNGAVGYAFYQPHAFSCGDDVHVLVPKEDVPPAALLFVCAVLRFERYRFSYGRKWHLERMRKSVIRLPGSAGQPDWAAMEKYMLGLPHSSFIASNDSYRS